jgi:hypothetical protein
LRNSCLEIDHDSLAGFRKEVWTFQDKTPNHMTQRMADASEDSIDLSQVLTTENADPTEFRMTTQFNPKIISNSIQMKIQVNSE